MIDTVLNYFNNSSAITFFVLALLSVYLILVLWIFFYKNFSTNALITNEKKSLESLTSRNSQISPLSKLSACSDITTSKEILHACEISIIRDASSGISWLSIVSSTSPFNTSTAR
mgnify:CR=1 FL=1